VVVKFTGEGEEGRVDALQLYLLKTLDKYREKVVEKKDKVDDSLRVMQVGKTQRVVLCAYLTELKLNKLDKVMA